MTEEDRKLLFQELCARYPYKIVCKMTSQDGGGIIDVLGIGGLSQAESGAWEVKPYLRSLEDMTDEERDDFADVVADALDSSEFSEAEFYNLAMAKPAILEVKWLLEHHFDNNDLIGKDLAIRVTPENNPYK